MTFSCGDFILLYLPYTGLAAAKIDVLALSLVVIPALAMETVYCSMTSCMATQSCSSILSNSSIQQIPLSASTSAPPSKTISFVEPPTSYISNVSFTFSKPKISGAIDHINFLRFSSAFEMFSMLSKSDLFLPMSSYDSLTF